MTHMRLGTLLASALVMLTGGRAAAQTQPAPLSPPPPKPVTPPPAMEPPPPMAPAPPLAEPPPVAYQAPGAPAPVYTLPTPERVVSDNLERGTDHDTVIGRWGFEAISLGTTFPLRGGPTCPDPLAACNVALNAAGVRLWTTRNMAFNIDLAFALGGGSYMGRSADTYFGVGPAGGVSLLLGNWKHMAISFSPQGAFVFFAPGGSTAKNVMFFTARALVEAELHFGFAGLPALSLGLNTGLVFNFLNQEDTLRNWSFTMAGPQSVWGALSGFFVRYYM